MKPPYEPRYVMSALVCTLIFLLLVSALCLWGVPEQYIRWIAYATVISFVCVVERHKFMSLPRSQRAPLILAIAIALALSYYSHDPIIMASKQLFSMIR